MLARSILVEPSASPLVAASPASFFGMALSITMLTIFVLLGLIFSLVASRVILPLVEDLTPHHIVNRVEPHQELQKLN
ncbi:uncharacterized protein G2W53_020737 [Senna tora]|uniref:Uncharacterized protein n=1 Tax=Senna tora TaxID=362788 RepID=A0A834TIA2_9FABA|nr:uncharacterized protein G2W53_020737 [Senna tora]